MDTSGLADELVACNLWLCILWAPLRHSLWLYLSLIGQQDVNGAALESWLFVVDYELRYQFINYYDIL